MLEKRSHVREARRSLLTNPRGCGGEGVGPRNDRGGRRKKEEDFGVGEGEPRSRGLRLGTCANQHFCRFRFRHRRSWGPAGAKNSAGRKFRGMEQRTSLSDVMRGELEWRTMGTV